MIVKLIPKPIQEKLKAKERALSYEANNKPFGEEDASPLKPKDIQSRTTFVRMCSNKKSVINKIITGGELKNTFNDEATEVATTKLLFGKRLYQKKKNGQIRPISGLKSIEVAYKSSFKAIREATVNWVIASLDDLDELTPYFLTVGKTVALDWGWINSNVNSGAPMFDGQTPFITYDDFVGSWVVDQSIFNNPQTKIQNAGGDYDALAGKISNFETTLREDGGFDCVTKITAIGAALFSTPMDKPSNQTQIETAVKVEASNDEAATGDTKTKTKKVSYDVDNIMNAIINLKSIVYQSVFNILPDTKKAYKLLFNDTNVLGDRSYHSGKKHGFAVDSPFNPQVLWMTKEDKEDVFVKWGYMEDQILNRYVAVNGGGDSEIKMTIRSIDSVIDEETNLPKLVDELNDFIIENPGNQPIIPGAGAAPNDEGEVYGPPPAPTLSFEAPKTKSILEIYPPFDKNNLETTEADSTSTAGVQDQQIKEYLFPDTKNKYLEEEDTTLSTENLGRTLKTPTLIRNSEKFLKPKEPFKFFSTELLPTFDEVNEFRAKGIIGKLSTSVSNAAGNVTDANFKKFYNALRDMKDHKFTNPQNKSNGRLRYMWVNIKEIQKAFGVIQTEDSTIPTVKPKGTLEQCLKSLLSQLNHNFYDFWDFELTVDPYDPSTIKVMDKKMVNIDKTKLTYTKYKDNSHKVNELGIYKFPTYKVGSMVKRQSLAFKIPDSMAITIMHGANKQDKKNESNNKFNNSEIMKFFGNTKGIEYDDEYLDKITSAAVPKSEKNTFVNVGSENTSHNSRIVAGQGLIIKDTNLWKQWTGDEVQEGSPIEVDDKANRVFGVRTKFEIIDDNLVYMKEEAEPFNIFDYETWLGDSKKETAKYQQVDEDKTPSLYTYEGGNLILKKEVEKVIRNRLTNGPIDEESDTLRSDSIIPAELSLEVDGIGGMVPGDVIQAEYIQPQYNAEITSKGVALGPYTYFQVFGLNQRVDSAGWTTELVTKMRKNHIPALEDLSFGETVKDVEEEVEEEEKVEIVEIEKKVEERVELPRIVPDQKIDPDDYEEVEVIDAPGISQIPTKSRPLGFPGTYEKLKSQLNLTSLNTNKIFIPKTPTDDIQKGSTYNNLQIGMEFKFERKLPKGTRPKQDIPGEEADIFEYTKEEQDEIDNFGDDFLLEDFSNFDKPPKKVEKIVEKKKEKQKLKNSKKQKVNPTVPPKSTYKASLEQNSWYYQIREDWRTLYRKQSGTGINALSGAKQSYNPKQYQTIRGKQVEIFNIVREAQHITVRRAWWDKNIEEPNESGESALTSLADIDVTLIKDSGFLRENREVYWRGKYNPKFEG